MTVTKPSEAVDEMFTMLKDAWETDPDTALIPIVWGNVAHAYEGTPDLCNNQEPWLHVQALHETARTATLRGPFGARDEHQGTLIANLRWPESKGTVGALDHIRVAGNAFKGQASPSGVWFRNTQYTDLGHEGTWYVVSMSTTFLYDLIR